MLRMYTAQAPLRRAKSIWRTASSRSSVGTTHAQRRRLSLSLQMSASQRLYALHRATSTSTRSAMDSMNIVGYSTWTSIPSSSMCCRRAATFSAWAVSSGVSIRRPACAESAANVSAVSTGRDRPRSLPSMNQYARLSPGGLTTVGRYGVSAGSR
jgi:hypothetical protein